MGRKRLDAQYTEIGHDKHSEDNKMRKLKTNLLEYILIELNESLMNKKYKIYRIDLSISILYLLLIFEFVNISSIVLCNSFKL